MEVAWAANGFVLSASMDNTLRLFHVTRQASLRTMQHGDFVTCADFNPTDNGYCVSGCLDKKIRIWNVREARVMYRANVGDYVTAVRFSPDGTMVFAGTFTGKCYVLAAVGLPLITRLEVRSRRGQNHDRKVTGIDFPPSGDCFLVTTNDSRVRAYSLPNYQPIMKYIGMINQTAQIKATYSPHGRFVTCGSENNECLIFDTEPRYIPGLNPTFTRFRKDHNDCSQYFLAHQNICTCTLFAPIPFPGTYDISTSPELA